MAQGKSTFLQPDGIFARHTVREFAQSSAWPCHGNMSEVNLRERLVRRFGHSYSRRRLSQPPNKIAFLEMSRKPRRPSFLRRPRNRPGNFQFHLVFLPAAYFLSDQEVGVVAEIARAVAIGR